MSPLADGSATRDEPSPTQSHPEPVPGPPGGAEPEEPRRHPSTVGGVFYLLVLGATVAGLVVATLGSWRTGVRWIAGALVAAAVLRAVLPRRDAGMLAVRARWLDTVLLAGVGGLLWFLAGSVPEA